MKIIINVEECEGTEKEIVQERIRRFILENFQKGNKAEIKIS